MSFFKTIPIKILSLSLIFLLLMSVYRLIFFVYCNKCMDLSNLGLDILQVFYMGVRFDLSVIYILNTLPVILFINLYIIWNTYCFKFFFKVLLYGFYRSYIKTVL